MLHYYLPITTPRKIIRNFVNACNSGNEVDVLKNVSESIIFERRQDWKTIVRTDGIEEFKAYLSSQDQHLYGENFKIRSSWNFSLTTVTIGVKYFPKSDDPRIKFTQKYGQIKFKLEGDRIVNIVDEC